MLTLIKPTDDGKLLVRCDCGRELVVTNSLFQSGRMQFCGLCQPDGTEDLTGRVFDKLTVIERVVNSPGGLPRWRCRCECGNETIKNGASLLDDKYGHSCGCTLPVPGSSPFRIPGYQRYHNMIERCNNPKNPDYQSYGGRGIKVCDRWMESFDNFWEDMKDGYQKGLQLDRINNDGNYEKDNCRWATPKENNRNKRTNRFILTKFGKKTIAEQAEIARLPYGKVYDKLTKGLPEELTVVPKHDISKDDITNLQHLYDGDVTIVSEDEAARMKELMKMAEVQAKAVKDWGASPDEIEINNTDNIEGVLSATLDEDLVAMLKKD